MTEFEIACLRRQVSTLEAENARLRAGAGEASGARDRHYRAILESAVDFAIIATDHDGRVTDWNTGAERIFGWSAEAMRGEPVDRIFTVEDQAKGCPAEEMRRALDEGRAADERWHLRRDGSRFWASGEMMPLRDDGGAHLGYLKILRDRTEQIRAAEALRRNDENLQFALDAARLIGAWNWAVANDRVYADARFARLYSVDPARAADGAPVAEFIAGIHPEDRDRVGLKIQQALKEAGEFAEEYRLVQPDGSVHWVLARGRAYHDEHGTPARFPGIVVDITGRKRVEEALRASEERLRVAQSAGGIGTFEWFPEAGKLDVSDEYRRIWGIAPDVEVTADLLVGLLHPDDRGLSGPARLRPGENPLEYVEYRIIRADTGEERWIARRGEVVPGDTLGTRRFLGVALDITERKRTEAALAESEAHFRATFEQAAVGVAHVGIDGRWLQVNARLCTMLGYTEAELLERTFQEITHPDDLATNLVHIHRLLSGEIASMSLEKRYVRADGGTVWAALTSVLRRDPKSGAPLHFISVFQDITERKRAEDALRENEEQLRLATEAAEIGLWDVDMVTDTLFWPPRVKAMFGISANVPVSMADFYAGLHPDDRERVSAAFAAAVNPAQRTLYDVEYRTIGKEDGVLRWVAAKGRALFGADGTCLRVLGTAIDITPRKRAEAALRESEARYRILTEVSPQTVWMARADGFITYCNQWWFDYTGLTMEETEGEGWIQAMDPDYRARFREVWPRFAAAGSAWNFEIPFRRASDGQYRWHLAKGLPIRDGQDAAHPDGRITGWMGVAIDIHEQKLAREAMRELNEVLERRVAEEMAERAKTEEQLRQSQKMEAVGQLTGGLAHDFNNLLTGISGSLELIQARLSQGRTNDLDRYILAAQGASRRAAALTHRLLAFSRRQTLDPKPTKVDGLIAGMEDLIRRTVGPAVEVEVVGAAGLWPALVDPNQLESALLNLCINARDAMPDGGRLTIETANKWLDERAARERELTPGQYLSLCVTDTGTGMTPEVIQRAFDPFYTTKPIGMGTGLGLSMVYGFARQSGGQVRIYTELGQGTTMCLYLPRYLGQDDAAFAPSVDLAGSPRAEQGDTVLVVDDEPTVRMLVTEVLEMLGYTAIEAADGAAGLTVLQSDIRIDLLITDVGLPGGMNGRQVADAGRAARPGLKVLFITGYAENAVVGNGHLEPGMQVLTKPFTIEALANRIKDLIAEK